jgi:hypothetical protein
MTSTRSLALFVNYRKDSEQAAYIPSLISVDNKTARVKGKCKKGEAENRSEHNGMDEEK